ncbi:hypothetical protein VC899_24430 [Citrobacter braakii]|uniref:hypothetical protein n=1 Tax=Citrobacter braakii TaxID=57706 RepID=UPI002B24102E|nr:hypothetical protein [Citrobacter braakii]MEB0968294.1 hypothetical protein [Citrobacter braakii]
MANAWLRLWHDMPNDPKWRTIARVSKQPIATVQAVFIHLLVSASRNVTRGHTDVTTEDLASALDVTEDEIDSILQAMQGRVLDGAVITGWAKRQVIKEDIGNTSPTAKTPAERKRAQREREKLIGENNGCHDESRNVTHMSRRVTTDTDTDTDIKTDLPLNPPQGKSGEKKFDPLGIVLPDWIPVSLWREWVEFRKALRKPIRTAQGANGAIRELDKFRQQGFTPELVIRHSIAHEYQGLYPPKDFQTMANSRNINSVSQPDNTIPPGFKG